MDFTYSPEQRALRDSILRFARERLNAQVVERDRAGAVPRALIHISEPTRPY